MSIDPSAMPPLRHGAVNPVALKLPTAHEPSRDAAAPPPRHVMEGARAEEASVLLPERDTAGRVLAAVAERALERPPRDLQKLVASAAKFLLINLEPALELAKQVRQDSIESRGTDPLDLVQRDRNGIAADLLLSE